MTEYRTEQKRILLEFLKEHCESSFSIEELIAMLRDTYGEKAPGKSTVYRLMTRLVEESTVKRFVVGHSRGFVYQIIKGDHCHYHLHLKCMDCGKLLHLDEKTSDELLAKVALAKNFSVSEEETVLFGRCANCKI